MLEVKELKYIEDYTLWLLFSDGTEGCVNLEASIWGPAFEPLKEVSFFKKAFISPITRTVTWPNDVDFAPEYLRSKALAQAEMMQASEDAGEYNVNN